MAIFRDVVVNIQRLTGTQSLSNQGLCLVLTTETTAEYKEYTSIELVTLDFEVTTAANQMAAAIFNQSPSVDRIAIVGIQSETDFNDIINGLNQVQTTNGGFTFLVSNVSQMDEIQQLSQWATDNSIFYVATIAQAEIDTLVNPESDYVIIMVHDDKASYPDAALVGRCSTFTPGSATWMFKELTGIEPMNYTDQNTMIQLLNTKHYMTYVSKHGMNMTTGGFVTSGEYMDVMLGVLFIKNDMELRVQRLLNTTPKVPYTNEGIALIVGSVEETLRLATENQIIRSNDSGVGEYTIEIPDAANISAIDKANRELKGINWVAYLSGAIHHVIINGIVQY